MNRIHIRQASSVLEGQTGETILEAALGKGIAYPHSCRSGRCGTCKSHLLSGEVDMLPHSRFALSAGERQQGMILACKAVPRGDVAVAWIDELEPEIKLPVQSATAIVLANRELGTNVRQLIIDPLGEAFTFHPGQYMRLTFPGSPPRNYSPASQPAVRNIEFHVGLVKNGAASRMVESALPPGTEIGLTGPFGNAYLRESHGGPILAASAGTGLAAVLPVVERALHLRQGRQIQLYVVGRSDTDFYMKERLDQLAATHPKLSVRTLISGQPERQRIETLLLEDLQHLGNWRVHTAGPPRFVDAVRTAVQTLGVPPYQIHADPFYSQA